jgi:FkbM family methyltransferase
MKIKYGIRENNIDVTGICLSNLTHNNIIKIPNGDCNRCRHFTDPLYGTLKKILIELDGITTEYNVNHTITINLLTNTITSITEQELNSQLNYLHSKLKLNYGSFSEELPEQRMAIKNITGKEKILEIGGNIGRNSLILSYLLEDQTNLVVLESDPNTSKQLIENRDNNNHKFHVENAALSKRKLIQKAWDTIPSETVLEGYTEVNTITMEDLKTKYNILFDTLVLDCEGAFYYILMDMPEILDNIQLIIMENDYKEISKKLYIDNVLKKNNFYVDHVESGGWGPCYNNFFEVWRRE